MPGNFYDLIQQATAQPTSQGSQDMFAASPTPGPQGLGGKSGMNPLQAYAPVGQAGKGGGGTPGMGGQPLVAPSPGAMTPAAALNPASPGFAAYHPAAASAATPATPAYAPTQPNSPQYTAPPAGMSPAQALEDYFLNISYNNGA